MTTTATGERLSSIRSLGPVSSSYRNSLGELLLIGIFVPAALVVIWLSWDWPLVLDGPLFQYGAFLMDRGKVLYRDIFEMNFPGAYFTSWLELHLLGYSDFGWRLYDLLFLLLGCVGIAFICKPFGKLATILGSSLLILTHIQLGPREIGERDFQVAVCALLSAGFMAQGLRDGKRRWLLASGVLASLGGAIKPPGFLFLAAFMGQVVVVSLMRKQKRFVLPLWMGLGAALPCLLAGSYLWWNGAWSPFVEVFTKLIPMYASIRRPTSYRWGVLTGRLEAFHLLIAISGLLLVCKRKDWFITESGTVALGIGCGVASYWLQGKGFPQHLDPLFAFLCVWCGLAVATLMRDGGVLVRLPLAAALALWIVVQLPAFVYVPAVVRPNKLEIEDLHNLETQIASLRAAGKDKGIQVLDATTGAIHALYDLKLDQSSEFVNDSFFYGLHSTPFARDLRSRFIAKMTAIKPDLLVVSYQSWPDLGYERINQWPELLNLLNSEYELKANLSNYRIYVHR